MTSLLWIALGAGIIALGLGLSRTGSSRLAVPGVGGIRPIGAVPALPPPCMLGTLAGTGVGALTGLVAIGGGF